jgi:ABC-type oligopeptide transport system substrate-binding subunit
MMKKNKLLLLCTLLVAGTVCLTACGNTGNNGSEAPYEDETDKNANDTNNGDKNMYNDGNGATGTEDGTMGGDLKDAGRNLMDSIKDTGDAIRDGVNNLGNGNNRTNP